MCNFVNGNISLSEVLFIVVVHFNLCLWPCTLQCHHQSNRGFWP